MANIVEVVLKGDDRTQAAYASARRAAKDFEAVNRTMTTQLKSSAVAFQQASSIAQSFGANALAGVIQQTAMASIAFKELNQHVNTSKLAMLGAIGAAAAVGVEAGTAIRKWGEKNMLGPWDQQIALMDLAGKVSRDILSITDATKLKQQDINQEYASGLGLLEKMGWISEAELDNMREQLKLLKDLKLGQLPKPEDPSFNKGFEIGQAITARARDLAGGSAAAVAAVNAFFDAQAKGAQSVKSSEEDLKFVLDRINEARTKEMELLTTRGVLAAADRDRALTEGLAATVLFTEQAKAASLSLVEAQRGMAATYLAIWSESLLNVRAAFTNFASTALTSFSTGFGNTIGAIASGAQKASEAFKQLGQQMLGMLVSFATRLAVNTALALAFQGVISKATLVVAATTAAAWAPAAAFASLATLGSNAAAANAAIIGTVGLAQGLAVFGQAHAGLTNVPQDQTLNIQGGERIVSKRQNEDLTRYLEASAGGGGGRTVHVTVMLDGRAIFEAIGAASRDGRLQLDARSVV